MSSWHASAYITQFSYCSGGFLCLCLVWFCFVFFLMPLYISCFLEVHEALFTLMYPGHQPNPTEDAKSFSWCFKGQIINAALKTIN